jgi:hypothetical protein
MRKQRQANVSTGGKPASASQEQRQKYLVPFPAQSLFHPLFMLRFDEQDIPRILAGKVLPAVDIA